MLQNNDFHETSNICPNRILKQICGSFSGSEKMEELKRLEKLQNVLSAITSYNLLSSSSTSDLDSSRFLSNLVLFLVQPCGELDIDSKLGLVSEFLPKFSGPVLKEISRSLERDDETKPVNTSSESQKSYVKRTVVDNVDRFMLQKHREGVAMVGLDAMKRANSTLEDFSRSYFMFHQLEINEPHSIFQYLTVLSFTESYIYQMDALNEKIVSESACGSQVINSRHRRNAESRVLFETDPLKPLGDVLEREGLFTQRIQQEFRSGKEYWALERKLCHDLSNRNTICLEDVMRAIHLKSFDYRVLNLLLYKLRGVEVNELHMDFLSISEFLIEVADDLYDYEATRISEAEDKYEEIMKSLDPHLSSKYQRRCEEATKEGGKISGHSLGTWNIPAVISDEEAYRTAQRLK